MELQPYALYPTFLLLLLALLLLLKLSRRGSHALSGKYLPPGPRPWPVIGNLDLIGPPPAPQHPRPLREVRPRHAAEARLVPGGGRLLSGSRQVLPQDPRPLLRRPPEERGRGSTPPTTTPTSPGPPYGPYWRQALRTCLTELFSARRLRSHEHARAEELRALVRDLYCSAGRSVVLKDLLSTLSLNVISRMVLGTKKYLQEEGGAVVTPGEFKRMLDELFLLSGVLDVGDSMPWLRPFDLQGHVGRMKALSRKFDRFLERVLDEHGERRRKEGEGFVAGDMVDVLLQLADDPGLEVKLSRDGVKAFTQDLIAGGTESSAVTVEWAISELLRRPEVITKATEELDRVIGMDRWVDESDIHRLPTSSP